MLSAKMKKIKNIINSSHEVINNRRGVIFFGVTIIYIYIYIDDTSMLLIEKR